MEMNDFVQDGAHAYLRVLKEAGALPDYVEFVPEASDLENLPSVAFADSGSRKFPVHDKAAAFLSAVYAFLQGATSESGSWVGRIKTACVAHGIDQDVARAHTALAAPEAPEAGPEKSASSGEKPYALELAEISPGGPSQKFYPIGTAHEIEESARKMASDLRENKLPLAWMSDAAELLVKAAAEKGVRSGLIPASLRRLGRAYIPDASVLGRALQERRDDPAVSDEAYAVYKTAADLALSGEMSVNDAALVWQTADRKFGIHEKHAGDRDPLWAFKSGYSVEQVEQIKNACCMVGGTLIPKIQLDRVLDEEIVRNLVPDDARVTLLAKRAAVGPDATRLLNDLSEEGVRKLSGLILEAGQTDVAA